MPEYSNSNVVLKERFCLSRQVDFGCFPYELHQALDFSKIPLDFPVELRKEANLQPLVVPANGAYKRHILPGVPLLPHALQV